MGRLRALAAPSELLLLTGGGSRLRLDAPTGRNPYGGSALPEPDSLAFASSTASTISALAYRAVEALRQELIAAGLAVRLPRCARSGAPRDQAGHPAGLRGRRSRRHRGRADAVRHRWRVRGAPSRAPAGERAPGQSRDRARGDRARGAGTRPGACISRARRRPAGRSSRARRWPVSNRRRSRSRRSRSGQPTARPAVAARSMPRSRRRRCGRSPGGRAASSICSRCRRAASARRAWRRPGS